MGAAAFGTGRQEPAGQPAHVQREQEQVVLLVGCWWVAGRVLADRKRCRYELVVAIVGRLAEHG